MVAVKERSRGQRKREDLEVWEDVSVRRGRGGKKAIEKGRPISIPGPNEYCMNRSNAVASGTHLYSDSARELGYDSVTDSVVCKNRKKWEMAMTSRTERRPF